MKQKLLYICLLILCALAWSGEAWGDTDLPLSITKSNYSSYVTSNDTWSWGKESGINNDGICLGNWGMGFDWNYKTATIHFNGIPSQITFTCESESGASRATLGGNRKNKKWIIKESSNGSNWTTILSTDDNQSNKSLTLSSTTRYIQLIYGWNLAGVFSNVVIKPTHYVKAKAAASTGGTAYTSFTSYDAATTTSATSNSGPTTNTTDLKTAYYKATASTGYEFLGWIKGTGSYSANSVVSTNAKYDPNLSYNSEDSSNPTEITYKAWFGPFFEFSATAIKIFDHGTVSAEVSDSKIVGSPSSTSKSTTATFTANPSTGCTFIGWYEDAAHTKFVSSDIEYSTSIENSTVGSKKNLTLYAWFKANQTLEWTNPGVVNIVNGETVTGAAAAIAKSADTGTATGLAVTYTGSNNSVASVNETTGDVTGVSVPAAPGNIVTITATQAGNDEYNPVEATRQYTVINKYQAEFSPSFTVTTGAATFYVDDTKTIICTDTGEDFTFNSSDPSVVSISESEGVITLNALKVGTSTITLTQPPTISHYAASATYNVTVARVPNNLKFSLAATETLVDGTIDVSFTDRNNTDTPIVGTITEQSLSSGINQTVNNETPVITYADGVITACNAGTAKITFSQAETNKYEGCASSTYTITVLKHRNSIVATVTRTEDGVSSTNLKLKYGKTATLSYTYENTISTPNVTRRSGTYTTQSGNIITAGNSAGIDIYEITQAETYKYEAGYTSFTIRVNNTDEVEGYVCYDESQYSHGTGSGVMHTYTLSGPGETLSYEVTRDLWAIYYHMYVESSPDNSNWTQIQDNQSIEDQKRWRGFSETVPENARYVRFRFPSGGDLTKYIRNTKVTRKTYLRETHDNTALGTVLTGTTQIINFNVSYSSTNGGNISIRSDNEHFVPSISSIAVEANKMATSPGGTQYICGVDGSQAFTVTYTPDPNSLGEESATIFIEDLFNTKTITLTATAAKRENTLDVICTQDLKVDDVVADVYSSKNSTASLNCNFSREGVATYDPATNKLIAIGAGTTTLTLIQLENDFHYGTTKTVDISVSKYDQTISWDNELTDVERTLDVGTVLTTNTATASSGLAVTYSSSNASALEVDAATGDLTAKAGGSNIAITATQVGNYKYNEVSVTRYFMVIQKEDPVVTTTLSESETNMFPIGNPDITIRCNATITESALTITGNAEGIVSLSFADNTFTIKALKEGTVTLTLTRAQDEGYNALNKTYTICVVKPVVVLEPTVSPVFAYSEYSKVTLNNTLKAGYSTISLPFNTTVSDIVGTGYNAANDWVAQLSVVTYNAQDGYSLYFEKKSEIIANQPYILHLGAEVDSPVFTNISVVAAVEGTQNATKGVNANQWILHANYNPTFEMDGYYGVVGEKIKKGTEGSSLKAYHAYIEGPTVATVRAAYLDDDEADGLLELIRSEQDEVAGQQIYDLQGRKLSREQRGINIVVRRDGKVTKVLSTF